ncbi:MAG TPA: hypothetical protein VEK09_04045, partial [Jatrophihabitantaceae bacterium]|nr:hypothetical protein [Jatrophihabitantaceae bacterium]
MQLDEYVRQVHDQLRASAALGDDRTAQIAGALAGSADSAVRLAILAAVSDAAAEITAALLDTHGGPVVTVVLDGDEVRVDISRAGAEAEPSQPPPDDGDATARISLRMSEKLKADVEHAAGSDGVSVNTWLVRAAGAALNRQNGSPGGQSHGGWPGGWPAWQRPAQGR